MKRCSRCQGDQALDAFYPDKSKRDGHHTVCKECVKADRKRRYIENPAKYKALGRAWHVAHREQTRGYYREARTRVLAAYGGRCACCRETEPQFLSIDHVNNDGAEHRREVSGGSRIYYWLWKQGCPQDGRFQILCHNCNMAKAFYGSCPHARVTAAYGVDLLT